MITHTYAQLRNMPKDQLINLYDKATETVGSPGLNFYRDELVRRELTDFNSDIRNSTRRIEYMTAAILIATLVNVVIFAVR